MEIHNLKPDILIHQLEEKVYFLMEKCKKLSHNYRIMEQNNYELKQKLNQINEENVKIKKQIDVAKGEEDYGFFLENIVNKIQDKEDVKTKLGLVVGELDKMIDKIKKYN